MEVSPVKCLSGTRGKQTLFNGERMKNLKGILTHGTDGEFIVTLGLIAIPVDKALAKPLLNHSMKVF